MDLDFNTILFTVSIWALPVLVAVTFHEAAHGWVACRLGDPTAKSLGRVTFNPIKHIDIVGTIVLPVLMLLATGGKAMFGFAKPVPVNFGRLRSPRRDMVLVAAAGPAMNILLALSAAALFYVAALFDGEVRDWLSYNLGNMLFLNILLAVFNMLPIPPLDGGRVAVGVLPWSVGQYLAKLERVGIFLVIGAIFFLPWIGSVMGVDLNVFWTLIIEPTLIIQDMIVALFGLSQF